MARRTADNRDMLLEAGRLLSAKLELGELLAAVLELAAKVSGAETASLLLIDEKTRQLYFHTALGLGPEAAAVRLDLGQGIAGCVARDRKAEIINDVRADSRWSASLDRISGFTTRSLLAVPMQSKGRLVGVVEAINKRSGRFTARDLAVLEAFASQAAIAIENAGLFASLNEERRRLRTILREMSDGAILADAEGRVLLANQAARKFFAVGEDLPALDRAFAGMEVTPPLAEILRSPTCEFTARRDEPQTLILSGTASRTTLPAQGREAEPGWLLILRDVTDETLKIALKRTFLSIISHKLRTPLAAVTGFSDLLLAEFQEHPPQPLALNAAQTVATQARKLSGLVDKLLRYVTVESPETALQISPTPIDDVVAEALQSIQGRLGEKTATLDFSPSGISVLADRSFLVDAVRNLVENAVKFGDKPQTKVSIRVAVTTERALLSVSDNGPGIPPEDQDRVFSRFHQVESSFTGQVDGWGLGLPFVKKVASMHGGEVSLASRLGEGTTVTISLPRSRP